MTKNRGGLSLVTLVFVGLAVLFALLSDGYIVGVVHGGLVVGLVSLVLTSFHLVTGSHRWLAGAWGEDNTQDELRRARRRRLIVGWVDNLEIQSGDVDHLVALRDGQLLALDSKWHAATSFEQWRRHVTKAEASAARARNILRHLGVARPQVRAVVVVWGGAQSDLPAPWVDVDGVPVVAGRALKQWLAQLQVSPEVNPRSTKALLRQLRKFRREVSVSMSLNAKTA